MSRREQALDAALAVLAEAGTSGLTHRAVDRRGALPSGTASNYFRTRDALFTGALGHLVQREIALIQGFQAASSGPHTVESLIAEAAGIIEFLLGPARAQTVARHAIFLEAAWGLELRDALLAATAPFWNVLALRLADVGAPSPQESARTLLACIDGIILDQLIRPQDSFDATGVLRPLVGALTVGAR